MDGVNTTCTYNMYIQYRMYVLRRQHAYIKRCMGIGFSSRENGGSSWRCTVRTSGTLRLVWLLVVGRTDSELPDINC